MDLRSPHLRTRIGKTRRGPRQRLPALFFQSTARLRDLHKTRIVHWFTDSLTSVGVAARLRLGVSRCHQPWISVDSVSVSLKFWISDSLILFWYTESRLGVSEILNLFLFWVTESHVRPSGVAARFHRGVSVLRHTRSGEVGRYGASSWLKANWFRPFF